MTNNNVTALDFGASCDQSYANIVAAIGMLPEKDIASLKAAYIAKKGDPADSKVAARYGGWAGTMLDGSMWNFSWEKSEPRKDLHMCYYLRGKNGYTLSDDAAEILAFGLKRPPLCKDWVIEKRDGENVLCAYVMDGVKVEGDGGCVLGIGGESAF